MLFDFSSLFVLKFGGFLHKTATYFVWGGGSLTLVGEQHFKIPDKRYSREKFQAKMTTDPGGWKC